MSDVVQPSAAPVTPPPGAPAAKTVLVVDDEPQIRRVLRATARIPYGAVSSYKLIAASAGSPRAFRAAGTALGGNPLPIVVPCHRVLHTGGGVGGYAGGIERKRALLGLERGQG